MQQLVQFGFDDLTATDVWVGLALVQTLLDPQDPHLHAPFLWHDRLALGGSSRRASVLLVEGVGDGFVPNHATEALAAAFGGISVLEPGRASLPGLASARAPLSGNIDGETTGALVQWTPLGVPGRAASPGCSDPLAGPVAWEGHHCAQSAFESRLQRAEFFTSALGDGAPVVVDPLRIESRAAMESIRSEDRGAVVVLTLDRPKALNALDRATLEALLARCGELARRREVRAVVLTGEGRAFAAGADIAEMQRARPARGRGVQPPGSRRVRGPRSAPDADDRRRERLRARRRLRARLRL